MPSSYDSVVWRTACAECDNNQFNLQLVQLFIVDIRWYHDILTCLRDVTFSHPIELNPLSLCIHLLRPCQLLQILLRFHAEVMLMKKYESWKWLISFNLDSAAMKKLKFHVVNFLSQFNDVSFKSNFLSFVFPIFLKFDFEWDMKMPITSKIHSFSLSVRRLGCWFPPHVNMEKASELVEAIFYHLNSLA